MELLDCYESFPKRIVLFSNILSIAIYSIGAYILSQLWIWLAVPYVLYCLGMEIRVLQRSCVNCYYYGKVCAFGKGKLCSLFFAKGDPQQFAGNEISWLTLLPDFLVWLFPAIGGIVLLATDFTWLALALLLCLIILSTGGNAVVRERFACKYCKQREIGCPAENLFKKNKKIG